MSPGIAEEVASSSIISRGGTRVHGRGVPATLRPLTAAVAGVVAGVLPVFLAASLAGQIDRSFPLSEFMLGVAVALFHLVGVVISPMIGRLLPRAGVREMLWLSATTAATASIAIGLFARSATQLVGLLMIAGVSNGVAGPTASALLRATIPPDRHGLAFGTQQAGAPCSVLLAGLAVPGIAVPFGWRWAFVGVAAIAVLAAAAAPPLSREESRPMTRARVRGTLAESRATLAVIVLAAAVASAVGVAVVSFLVVFASQAGFSQSAAGLLLGCVSLLAMVGRIGFGLHADHAGTDPLVAALPLFLACTVGVTLLIAGTPIAIVSGALIIGALGWTWHGVITLAVVKRTEDAPVWAVGVLMSGVFAGAIVGPLLVGTLAHQLSFRAAWSVCAALSLVPLAAVGLARRRRPLRPPMNPEADALTVRRHYPAGREDCASECGRSPDAC